MAFSFYLEFIGLSIYKCMVSGSCSVHCACALDTTFRSEAKMSRQNILFIYIKCISRQLFFFSIRLEQQSGLIFFPECTSREYYVKNIM